MGLLYLVIQLYVVVVLARVLLSLFPIRPDSALAPVARVVHLLTEPPLAAIRSVVPTVRMGAVGLDLSATLLLLGLLLLASLVSGLS